ncbi:MAG TPA: M28 family peptidase [Chitinophagaceae bacterium]|jgi:hypothetical protein|nr:M28 family peptidase [Chitinophagaceae bacterium]
MSRQKIFLFAFISLSSSIARAQQTSLESFFLPDTLRALVEVLASDSMEGRFAGSAGCTKAGRFIAKEFEKAGVLPVSGNNKYFMLASPGVNVVGALKGKTKPQQLVIFSAHYDHIGTIYDDHNNLFVNKGGKKGDKVYNGANDNASGVAAVIALAKYFASIHNNERTILFVAFTGEELGLLGSKKFASRFEADSIVAVINIEMIGRENKKSSHPYITGKQYSDLFDILNQRLFQSDSQKYGDKFFEIDRFGLFERSDNYSFAVRGVPAHSIMATGDNDPYYHSLGDEVSTLNFKLMSDIVKAIALSCYGLISGEDAPKRIKVNL